MNKPYSESCDQNREAILSVLSPICSEVKNVLEVGSGTGQHAIYFASKLPHLIWQTSDCQSYLEGINLWLDESNLQNVTPPIELNVSTTKWPKFDTDAIFTANSVHIMHQADVVNLFIGAGKLLSVKGSLIIYGPFNYNGSYTSESNERFDQWLKDRDAQSGIKNIESLMQLATDNDMQLETDYEMPANNRILHFIKR